ncbi:hypothetical protein ACFU53_47505, partial [Streptomyces sp. NPDC057474]|uniref:hypothetical protein n=1 Tax=Streptomyces sp. NPDC057474 TaxID=3346144 RepID=UPI0036762243
MSWPVLSRSGLSGTLRSAASMLAAVPAALPVVGPALRPRTPGLWPTDGGVQIEVRHLGGPRTAGAAREVESALRGVPGVSRAEVNGTLGCVYVGCAPETDLERVAALVAAADAAARHAGAATPDEGAAASDRDAGAPARRAGGESESGHREAGADEGHAGARVWRAPRPVGFP